MKKELIDFIDWLEANSDNSIDKGWVDDYLKSINSVNPNELEVVRHHEGEKKVCDHAAHNWYINTHGKCLACNSIYKQ